MYAIIKHLPIENNVVVPVVLVSENDEILEFDTEEEAQRCATLFSVNSHNGIAYSVKQLH